MTGTTTPSSATTQASTTPATTSDPASVTVTAPDTDTGTRHDHASDGVDATSVLDVQRITADFPLLTERTIDGAPIVYLDSGNTSHKPRQVIDAMSSFMETTYAPINL
ncbi:MAG: hypothetical protein AAGG08_06540, partial [Actinomycetota bacterium]